MISLKKSSNSYLAIFSVPLGENLGCFGGSKKKKEGSSSNSTSPLGKSESDSQPLGETNSSSQLGYSVPKGTEMLWSPEVSFMF